MIRIAISLPKKIVNEFDEVSKENGYNSRQKALKDAMNDFIRHKK